MKTKSPDKKKDAEKKASAAAKRHPRKPVDWKDRAFTREAPPKDK